MGKRDLLLIVGFVVIGVIVYQLTAPDAGPGARGRSLSAALDHLRREIGGNRASAEATSSDTLAVSDLTLELRIEAFSRAGLSIIGEDRQDIASELHVRSTGYDEAEARQLAAATRLAVDDAAGSLVIRIKYPDPGTQWAALTLRVPARLRLRVRPTGSLIEIANVAGIDLAETGGDVTLRRIAGTVSGTHQGGTLTAEEIGSIRLNTRGSNVRVRQVKGDATLQIRAGELRAGELAGSLEIESFSARVSLENLTAMRGPIHISAAGGTVHLEGLTTEARIDGRNTRIELTLDRAVAVSVYNEGRDIDLTEPPAGFELDALATGGRITLPEGRLSIETTETAERAAGPIEGGGPTLTLRATRGNIILRARQQTGSR